MPFSKTAGWYTDPTSEHEFRYWSGSRWTEHVADAGLAGRSAHDVQGAPPPPDEELPASTAPGAFPTARDRFETELRMTPRQDRPELVRAEIARTANPFLLPGEPIEWLAPCAYITTGRNSIGAWFRAWLQPITHLAYAVATDRRLLLLEQFTTEAPALDLPYADVVSTRCRRRSNQYAADVLVTIHTDHRRIALRFCDWLAEGEAIERHISTSSSK